MNQETQTSVMSIHEVMAHLPHRFPFLLVDRVVNYTKGESLEAIKNVTINEPFFTGHFPQRPVMPGVLIIEALAQACGILVFLTEGKLPDENSLYYLAGVDDARFKRVVEPGDTLHLCVKLTKAKRDVWKFSAEAHVNGEIACSAELTNVKKDVVS